MTKCLDVGTGIWPVASLFVFKFASPLYFIAAVTVVYHFDIRFVKRVWQDYGNQSEMSRYDSSFKREYSGAELVYIGRFQKDLYHKIIDNCKIYENE